MIKHPVIAVLVTYQPDRAQLQKTVLSLKANFKSIVVVHNGPNPFKTPSFLKDSRIHFIDMKSNEGLARALNVGIKKALALGAQWAYLSDQDSTLSSDFVERMTEGSKAIPKNSKVAAIGPRYYNEITHTENSFIQLRFLRLIRVKPSHEHFIEAAYIISSGSFISKDAFIKIGPFKEALFIDFIDIEWGLRANYYGYKTYGLPKISFNHRLGDYDFKIFGQIFPIHSPLRMYYFFRNSIYFILFWFDVQTFYVQTQYI
jgi:rhamnosyltransferase